MLGWLGDSVRGWVVGPSSVLPFVIFLFVVVCFAVFVLFVCLLVCFLVFLLFFLPPFC